MIKTRLVLPVLAVLAALLLATGCGGAESSSSDLASVAPPESGLFVEGVVRPNGTLKANLEEVVQTLTGVDDLGGLIVSQLESSARQSGEEFDYETEVEPWLGERAAFFFQHYDGDQFEGVGAVVQSTDTSATQDFIDKLAQSSEEPVEEGSYEGVDYKIDNSNDTVMGIVNDFLVITDGEEAFKAAVDAANGEALADSATYADAASAAPGDSLADVYVDIGGLIDQAGNQVDAQTLEVLKAVGIDPMQATALASLVPGSERIEVALSSDLGGGQPSVGGDGSALLGSLPASSFAALALPSVGDRLNEALDKFDQEGIPGQVPPHQLKSTLKAAGLDLDRIAGSVEDAAVFAEGGNERTLSGALVLTTSGSGSAVESVASIGRFLRKASVPGVTATGGGFSGFSIHNAELGSKPLLVLAKDDRIVIGYGAAAAGDALRAEAGATLADSAAFKEAGAALGSTPITAFVDGAGGLRLVESLVPGSEAEFQEAKPYLQKISYLAAGGEADGGRATAKLILGLKK